MSRKIKWIDKSLIISPYSIGLCRDEESFHKELKRLKVSKKDFSGFIKDGKDACVHYFQNNNNHGLCCILCIRDHKKATKKQVIGLIVHEAVHIWDAIEDELNEHGNGSEFKAYAIQNIVQRLLEAL